MSRNVFTKVLLIPIKVIVDNDVTVIAAQGKNEKRRLIIRSRKIIGTFEKHLPGLETFVTERSIEYRIAHRTFHHPLNK